MDIRYTYSYYLRKIPAFQGYVVYNMVFKISIIKIPFEITTV